jgi:hypothetical protein
VFFTLSIWSAPIDVLNSAVPEHVMAVRFAYERSKALWSSQWHLTRLSRQRSWQASNVDWGGLAERAGVDHNYPSPFTSCGGEPIYVRPTTGSDSI